MLSGGATQPSWFSEHGEEKKDALAMLFSHIENGLSLLSTPRNGAEAGRSDAGSVCLGCFAGSEATRTFGLFADLHCGECSQGIDETSPRQILPMLSLDEPVSIGGVRPRYDANPENVDPNHSRAE